MPSAGGITTVTIPLGAFGGCQVDPLGDTQMRLRLTVPNDADGTSDVFWIAMGERAAYAPVLQITYTTP